MTVHLLRGNLFDKLECGVEQMCHPPYSPDLFPNLKKYLQFFHEQIFSTDDELKYTSEE